MLYAVLGVALMSVIGGPDPGTEVTAVSTQHRFTEGPVWTPWGTLLFSDTPDNAIWEIGKERRIWRQPSGKSNGLTFDRQGRLMACEVVERRVTRTEKDGKITVLADRYQGKRFNAPNDVVVRSDGSVYFTDPTYGRKPEDREIDFQGVYRVKPGGEIEVVARDFEQPNGLCFSPDERKLYIDDSSERKHVRVFDVAKDGSLSGGRVFATFEGMTGGPDGMKVDVKGNLYVAGPELVWVFEPSGKQLRTIIVPESPANIAWGGRDGKTLYITARTSVYKIKLDVGGKPPATVK